MTKMDAFQYVVLAYMLGRMESLRLFEVTVVQRIVLFLSLPHRGHFHAAYERSNCVSILHL